MGAITQRQVILVILAICALLGVFALQSLVVSFALGSLAPAMTLGEIIESQRSDISVETTDGWFDTPQFTSDGKHIVYMALTRPVGNPSGWDHDVWIMDRDGTNQTRLTRQGFVQSASVSPASGLLAFTAIENGTIPLFFMSVDGTRRGRRMGAVPFLYFSSWSPDGTRIAVSGIDPSNWTGYYILPDESRIPAGNGGTWCPLYITTPSDGAWERVANVSSLDTFTLRAETSWSPDGNRIAFPYFDRGWTGIGIVDLESGRLTRLTEGGGGYPRWNPRGDRIAFIEDGHIHVIGADGSGETIFPDIGGAEAISWNPAGSRLAYSTDDMVGILDPDSTNLTRLFNIQPGPVSWSPDGQTIAFSPGGGRRIRILTLTPGLLKMEEQVYKGMKGMGL